MKRGTGMLNGVLVGFGIIIASMVIPIIHYVAFPLSPFIAGFIGSGVAKIDQDGIVKFGALMAGLMFIPALIMLIAKFAFGLDEVFGFSSWWVVIIVLIAIPYTWFGSTVGALGGYMIRRNQENDSA